VIRWSYQEKVVKKFNSSNSTQGQFLARYTAKGSVALKWTLLRALGVKRILGVQQLIPFAPPRARSPDRPALVPLRHNIACSLLTAHYYYNGSTVTIAVYFSPHHSLTLLIAKK